MAALDAVNSIWLGSPHLKAKQQLTIKSFQAHGRRFVLWTYERTLHPLPEGVEVRDARELVPEEAIFRLPGGTHSGHLAFFCDYFQLTGLFRRGGWWTHMDVECLQPLPERATLFIRHWDGDAVCTYLVRRPPGCPAIAEALQKFPAIVRPGYHWHDAMRLLGRCVHDRGLPVATIQDGFHDDNDWHEKLFFEEERPDPRRCVHHWCHSVTGRFDRHAAPGSYFAERLSKYGVPRDA